MLFLFPFFVVHKQRQNLNKHQAFANKKKMRKTKKKNTRLAKGEKVEKEIQRDSAKVVLDGTLRNTLKREGERERESFAAK